MAAGRSRETKRSTLEALRHETLSHLGEAAAGLGARLLRWGQLPRAVRRLSRWGLADRTEPKHWPADNLWDSFRRFVATTEGTRGTVVELGGRVVSPGARSLRPLFPHARFVAVDIHPSPDVDLVADAHALSEHLAPGSVDVLFSQSVFEHLMYPWRVVGQIHRVMRLGGLVYVNAPQSWPMHHTPNDFWRFSEAGLRLLFGPETGFEIVESGQDCRIWMQSEFVDGPLTMMPDHPAWGLSWIVVRKAGEPEPEAADTFSRSQQYPLSGD